MVRRALQGEIERDLQTQLPGPGDEGVEVLQRPQRRMDRVVPALRGADGPGHAHVLRARRQGVVGALAEGGADGVDGRQVDDVETHLRDGRKSFRGGAEGAVHRRVQLPALAAREELVPRAEQRPLPLHPQLQLLRGADGVPQRTAGQDPVHLGGERRREPGGDGAGGVAQGVHGGAQHLTGSPVLLRYAPGGPLVQPRALLQHQLDVLTCGNLDPGVVPPGGDGIAPGVHPERPEALGGERHPGAPAVGAGGQLPHRRPGPRTALRIRQHDIGGHRVVALAEHGGRDLELLPDHRLGRTAAAQDDRRHVQHGYTPHGRGAGRSRNRCRNRVRSGRRGGGPGGPRRRSRFGACGGGPRPGGRWTCVPARWSGARGAGGAGGRGCRRVVRGGHDRSCPLRNVGGRLAGGGVWCGACGTYRRSLPTLFG
ncbi:hypothetical protein B0E37_04074 [Streptomyces sp. MH192]|nr:hypothetical protein [Streptomyces sp. MH192]MCF0101467.1 hypothetical protein [Streptomyces sp. MH191]